jgi:hypothetical protein
MRHNAPSGNGNIIKYTVRKNGVATTILVNLASTASDGSNLVNSIAVLEGDLIDIQVTKAAGIATSPTEIIASLGLT